MKVLHVIIVSALFLSGCSTKRISNDEYRAMSCDELANNVEKARVAYMKKKRGLQIHNYATFGLIKTKDEAFIEKQKELHRLEKIYMEKEKDGVCEYYDIEEVQERIGYTKKKKKRKKYHTISDDNATR